MDLILLVSFGLLVEVVHRFMVLIHDLMVTGGNGPGTTPFAGGGNGGGNATGAPSPTNALDDALADLEGVVDGCYQFTCIN